MTSRLTSIELDTLRMWERRYGFPHPQRASGGSRLYSGAEVESLKLIRRALEQGYRPGEVVGKSREELAQLILVTSRAAAAAPGDATIPSLLAALARNDAAALRTELRQAAIALGPRGFIVEVAHPISVRVGQLWAGGKLEIRHEHMLTGCLSAQLRVLMAGYDDRAGAPRVLLTTLPGERHGLGLEMVQLYLALSDVTPILLGVDTPAEQIVKAARGHAVDAIGLLVTQASDVQVTSEHVRWLLDELPRRVALWIGGGGADRLSLRADAAVRVVTDWAELDAAIAALAR